MHVAEYVYGTVSPQQLLILLWAGTVTPQVLGKDVPSGVSAGVSLQDTSSP